MSEPAAKGYVLDLPNTCDEVLVFLAREAVRVAARDELISRYWPKVTKAISFLARKKYHFTRDVEDAQQEAYLWIEEAIRAYDALQLGQPRGSSFRTFFRRVLQFKLAHHVRGQQRFESHQRAAGRKFASESGRRSLNAAGGGGRHCRLQILDFRLTSYSANLTALRGFYSGQDFPTGEPSRPSHGAVGSDVQVAAAVFVCLALFQGTNSEKSSGGQRSQRNEYQQVHEWAGTQPVRLAPAVEMDSQLSRLGPNSFPGFPG